MAAETVWRSGGGGGGGLRRPQATGRRQVSRPPGAQTHGDAQSVPLGLSTGQETVDRQGNVAVFIVPLILLLLLLLLLSGKLTKLEASHSSCI